MYEKTGLERYNSMSNEYNNEDVFTGFIKDKKYYGLIERK